MTKSVTPFSLRDAPALIERLFPSQKLSAEAYKEQMAVHGKTLTALGSYWKGRKPLILNKACILGCLLPATDDLKRDLEIYEMLLAMDLDSLKFRLEEKNSKESRFVLSQQHSVGFKAPYRDLVEMACRPEECGDGLYDHVWMKVNNHLGTEAHSFPELVEQLGVMRFGHRPQVADTFCGSGQIPFEAARLGCDVYASDLNPMACMLTWGAFYLVGGSEQDRKRLADAQQLLVCKVRSEIDRLGVETDGNGWRAKVFLYCVETKCPQTGWIVPLLPTRVISKGYRAIADLVPDSVNKRYMIQVRTGVTDAELSAAKTGTVGREGKFGEAFLLHEVNGVSYKTKISTLRSDYQRPDGTIGNQLRLWEKADFVPRSDDLLQERLYCIQWMRPKKRGSGDEYQFRSVTEDDLKRDHIVEQYVTEHLLDWQSRGWVPDLRIEVGGPPRYQGLDLIRARGWTYWHHLFNPRQLLVAGLMNQISSAYSKFGLTQVLNCNSRLSRWNQSGGGGGIVAGVFDNQALNTLFNYGCRGVRYALDLAEIEYKRFPFDSAIDTAIDCIPADQISFQRDIFVTDPPYGDAVKYEEILDFFIGWLRKDPPAEFANWIWDSRRSLAIKGEGEDFRRRMVVAYKRMTDCLAPNGMQVIMFTHQSGSLWGDMANIVWASGLQVTAAWYVATEAEKRIQAGLSHVKGTVLLVLRTRAGTHKTTRDDLAWEIQEEVDAQVRALMGLNQEAKGLYRDENVFEDADIQMAGYAAALRVLTRYAIIDGRDMTTEAVRPRIKGETIFVDELIAFAVDTANQCLVPQGIGKPQWDGLSGAERFYLKLIDLEVKGFKTLDNYQNFAKAFKVHDFRALMASNKANEARLKSAVEFGKSDMSEGSELHESVLRAALYALMELVKNVDADEVLAHLMLNVRDYYSNQNQRDLVVELADYLSKKLETLRPEESAAARVLRELVKNQRLG